MVPRSVWAGVVWRKPDLPPSSLGQWGLGGGMIAADSTISAQTPRVKLRRCLGNFSGYTVADLLQQRKGRLRAVHDQCRKPNYAFRRTSVMARLVTVKEALSRMSRAPCPTRLTSITPTIDCAAASAFAHLGRGSAAAPVECRLSRCATARPTRTVCILRSTRWQIRSSLRAPRPCVSSCAQSAATSLPI